MRLKGDNIILILTGLSPSAHAAAGDDDPTPGWWEAMVGPGKSIDTDRWHVICLNSLGSCHGSTGPASINPVTCEPYRLEFPDLSIEDIADAAAFAVRALGFGHVACVIGNSMGGMVALALLARHPGLARSHINISGAVHALPFSIAIRSLQREAIRLDPNCYLYLSRSMDWFDLGETYRGSAEDALSQIQLEKALAIGVRSDILFPLQQQLQIAEGLETLTMRAASPSALRFSKMHGAGNDFVVLDLRNAPEPSPELCRLAETGKALQGSSHFPQSVNVGFAEIVARDRINLRVYEYGAGETLACGSGACAAAAVFMQQEQIDRSVSVVLSGGCLEIEWDNDDSEIKMTGPVAFVFEGQLDTSHHLSLEAST